MKGAAQGGQAGGFNQAAQTALAGKIHLAGARVFITGGAQGLGAALAKECINRGAKVLLGDIDETALAAQAAALHCAQIRCDVTRDEDLERVADWIKTHWQGVDIVINNAGVAHLGKLERSDMQDWRWVFEINVIGPARVTKNLLPLMGPGGHFLNVASAAGFLFMPAASAYSASKAAMVALSETMIYELAPQGIGVSILCPAFFRTNLAQNMRAADQGSAAKTKHLVEQAKLGADVIAAQAVAAMIRRDPFIFTHTGTKRTLWMKRLLPYRWFRNKSLREIEKLRQRRRQKADAKRG